MKLEQKTSISDIPLDNVGNDFGTERYVNGLIRFIQHSSTPITIALQGEWGSGKTSLMNKLNHTLCGDKGEFIGIEINTWEYSMLSTPEITVVKILHKLIARLTHPTLKEKATKYFGVLRSPIKAALGGLTHGISNGVGIGDVIDDMFDKLSNQPSELEQLKQVLNESIVKTINSPGKEKKCVIVFIDDLDRLNPPVAVEILELLKNIFSLNNCIFILAIDYEVVVKGLEPKFGKLTNSNEREFRSFFDKIIQVPFSLPVSNYHPMDFVLKSLIKIGYIRNIEDPNTTNNFISPFTTIVECSVGKNPRSIKRLINTLSLLDCIAHCGEDDDEFLLTSEAKIVNFAVVAIQVCYPKIYRMLTYNPDFTKWDEVVASKMNASLPRTEENNEDNVAADGYDWSDILEAVCSTDTYLTQRKSDIRKLFNLIQSTLQQLPSTTDDNDEMFGEQMRKLIDKSSVTGINNEFAISDFNSADFIKRLQSDVMKVVNTLRPDIRTWQFRKVFKYNGGIKIRKNTKLHRDMTIKFESSNDNGTIKCDIVLDCSVEKPERMKEFNIEQILSDEKFRAMLNKLDDTIIPMLNYKYVTPDIYYGTVSFDNYTDNLRYQMENDWTGGRIAINPRYSFSPDNALKFEQPEIINLIAQLVIANYDFQCAASTLSS